MKTRASHGANEGKGPLRTQRAQRNERVLVRSLSPFSVFAAFSVPSWFAPRDATKLAPCICALDTATCRAMEILDALIAQFNLQAHADAVRELARPCIHIARDAASAGSIAPSASRFGGMPYLPAGVQWPMWNGLPLGHIATIRLSEVVMHDATRVLPTRGMLYFWYTFDDCAWGFDPAHRGAFRVDYVADEDCELSRRAFPIVDWPKQLKYRDPSESSYSECAMSFRSGFSFANWEWAGKFAPIHKQFASSPAFWAMTDALREARAPLHRMLGHPDPDQGPMESECQLVSNGLTHGPSGEVDARWAKLTKGIQDWQLLLQVDTDESGPGWMWGDMGKIYYWIRRQDLAARDFSNVWTILQCG